MSRQAIVVSYHGPTNHNGARLIAKCDAGRITVHWDHGRDRGENYRAAASALCKKLGGAPSWDPRRMVGGWIPDGRCVFVFG